MSQSPTINPALNVSNELLKLPAFNKAGEEERAQFFDTITDKLENSGNFNRGQLKKVRDFSSQLKFHMGRQKEDLPIHKIYSDKIDDMGNFIPGLTKAEWDSKSEIEQFRLYETFIDSEKDKRFKQRLIDISEAATDSQTYSALWGVVRDGSISFMKNLPEHIAASASLGAMEEIERAGQMTPEIQAKMTEDIKAWNVEMATLEKEVAGEAYDRWKALNKANPYGTDFVKNRAIDAAVGVPFGISGALVRRGMGATAFEVGRSVVAPVVSSSAQGTAFDWGFEKSSELLNQTDWFNKLPEEQKTGARVIALIASLAATMPLDVRVQSLIAGTTGAEAASKIVNRLQDNVEALEKAAQAVERAKVTGQDVLQEVAQDSKIIETITDVSKEVGVLPLDAQTTYLHELLEEATITKQNLQNGAGILPHQQRMAEEVIDAIPTPETPLVVQAAEVGTKEASQQVEFIESAADEITKLKNRAEEARYFGDNSLAQAIENDITKLENGIASAVSPSGRISRLEELDAAIAKETDREKLRFLYAEKARLDSAWARETVGKMNNKQATILKQLNDMKVGFVKPSAKPETWQFLGLDRLGKADKQKADKLIDELIHNAYDRVPIITAKDYRDVASSGVARPGAETRLPEEVVTKATTVAPREEQLSLFEGAETLGARKLEEDIIVTPELSPLPKELEMPVEANLVKEGTQEAAEFTVASSSKTEEVLTDFIEKRWSATRGRPLTDAEKLSAKKHAKGLLQQTIERADNAPLMQTLEDGETLFSIAGLERKFPLLKGVLSRAVTMPTMVADTNLLYLKDGYIAADTIYQFMENMWGRFSLNDLPGWWQRNREVIKAADEMWELVRVNLPAPKENVLDDFMASLKEQQKALGLSEANMGAIKEAIEKLFPNFNLSARFDRAITGAGQFEAVLRNLVLHPQRADASTIMHELGHYYFSHILTSNERMSWLDAIRPAIEDTSIFTATFPDIAKRLMRMDAEAGKLGSKGAQMVMYQLKPTELFADTWLSHMFKNATFKTDIMEPMASMFSGVKGLTSLPSSHFDKLPTGLKQVLTKLSFGPSPEQLSKVKERTRLALKQANTYYKSAEEAVVRLDELALGFQQKYEAQGIDFFALPPQEQMSLLSSDDLMGFAEMHTLRLFQGAMESREIAEQAFKRLEFAYNPREIAKTTRAKIVEKEQWLKQRAPEAKIDTSEESLQNLAIHEDVEAYEISRYTAHKELENQYVEKRLYEEATRRQQEGLPELVGEERATVIKSAIEDFYEGAPHRAYEEVATEIANSKVANRMLNEELWQQEFANAYATISKGSAANDLITSDARLAAATRLVEFKKLRQLYNHALAEHGLLDISELDYFRRMDHAQQIAEIAWDTSIRGTIARTAFSAPIAKTMRYGAAYYLGWDTDENGNWFFNPELMYQKLVDSPFLMMLHPGARTGLKLASLGAKKIGSEIFGQLSPTIQKNSTELWDKFQHAFTEYKGADPTIELLRRASLRTAGNIKQGTLDAAETLIKKYDAEQRVIIGKIAERTQEGVELMEEMIRKNPLLVATAEKIRNLYKSNTDFLVQQGFLLPTERAHINKVWASKDKMNRTIILTRNPALKGLKLEHLKEEYVPFWSKSAKAIGEAPDGTKLYLAPQTVERLKALEATGEFNLVSGLELNGYYKEDEINLYIAPVGSSLDNVYKENFKPYRVWDEQKSTRGLILGRTKGAKGTPNLEIKREFTAAERELRGESFDAALKLAAFGNRIERTMAKANAFSRIANAGPEFAVSVSPSRTYTEVMTPNGPVTMLPEEAKQLLAAKGWKYLSMEMDKATEIRKYGPLADSMVSPEVYRMLRSFDTPEFWKNARSAYPLIDAYSKYVLMPFKLSKTVFNIPTHLVNFVSNSFTGTLVGRNPAADLFHGYGMMRARQLEEKLRQARIEGNIEEITKAEQAYKAHPYTEALKDARIARIGDSSLVKAELNYEELQRIAASVKETDEMGRIGALIDLAQAKARRVSDFMKHLYEGEDLIYKLGGFYADRKAGKSIEESLQSVYRAYFDYSSLPSGIAAIRDTGAIPFISYIYKSIPALLKGVTEKPERLAMVMLGAEAANLMMISMDYGMENAFAMQKSLDVLQPEHREKREYGIRTSIYAGSSVEKGADDTEKVVTKYLNIGKYLPGNLLSDSYSSGAIKQGKTIYEEIFSYFFSNPITNIGYTAVAKKEPYIGMEVKSSEEFAKHVVNTFVPNWPFIPTTRAYDALQQGLVNAGVREPNEEYTGYSSQGVARTLATESLNAALGVRLYRVDDSYEGMLRIKEAQKETREAKAEFKKSMLKPGLPQSAHADIIKQFEERVQKNIQHMERVSTAIERHSQIRNQTATRAPGLPQL